MISTAGLAPDRASCDVTASVKARSTAMRSTATHTIRVPSRSSTSARAASASPSPVAGLNQNACG